VFITGFLFNGVDVVMGEKCPKYAFVSQISSQDTASQHRHEIIQAVQHARRLVGEAHDGSKPSIGFGGTGRWGRQSPIEQAHGVHLVSQRLGFERLRRSDDVQVRGSKRQD